MCQAVLYMSANVSRVINTSSKKIAHTPVAVATADYGVDRDTKSMESKVLKPLHESFFKQAILCPKGLRRCCVNV